jgi:hypothetical protein
MPNDLERRFWVIVQNEARKARLQIASGCELYLQAIVRAGVQEMTDEGVKDDPAKVAAAEENLRYFLAEMIAEARRLNYVELDEKTFYHAKRKLCPLWPFCVKG